MLKIEETEVVGWEAAIRGMRNPMNSWGQSDSDYRPILCKRCDNCMSYQLEKWDDCEQCEVEQQTKAHDGFMIGPNDYDLMMRLRNAGTDHRKFMRMIIVYVDITAPLYWWKEYDTYKVGTVANSCSTMHKIAAKEFTLDDFSCEHLMNFDDSNYWEEDSDNACFIDPGKKEVIVPRSLMLNYIIPLLNVAREKYNEMSQKLKENDLAETERKYTIAQQKRFWWQMIQLLPTSYNQKRTIMLSYEVLANIYKSRRHHKLDEWHTFCDWIEGLPYSDLITGERNAK